MNWFKRKVIQWVRDDWDSANRSEDGPILRLGSTKISVNARSVDADPTLSFKVYSAIGGRVVEFSRYDRNNDRSHHQVYIIGKDEDFGEKIAKIAMLESLKD